MKIVLIGFMGAGKSTIGKELAAKLDLKFIDMEQLHQQRYGMTSAGVIDSLGETTFREYEMESARSLRGAKDCVISTGGGIVMNKLNLDYLCEQADLVVNLEVNFDVAKARVANSAKIRPLFRDTTKARELYILRAPLYRTYANVSIDVNTKTIAGIVAEIATHLPKSNRCRP